MSARRLPPTPTPTPTPTNDPSVLAALLALLVLVVVVLTLVDPLLLWPVAVAMMLYALALLVFGHLP